MRVNSNIVTNFIYSIIAPLVFLFSSIIFGLLWIVFQYNFLYVMIFKPDTKGFFYSIALNQLFTSIYVIKFYIVDLFLLMRNNYHQFVCVNQTMIMIIVTVMTIMFQFVLNKSFGFCFQFLSGADLRDKFELKNQKTISSNCN